jgi:hypothetical protein
LGYDAAAAILLALVSFLRVDFEVTDDQLDKVIGLWGWLPATPIKNTADVRRGSAPSQQYIHE